VLVVLDQTAGRLRGVGGDSGQPERVAVQDVVVTAALDQDGVVGGGLVQFLGGGQALLGEVELLPVGGGADPLTGRGDPGALADQFEELCEVTGAVDRHVMDAVGGEDQVGVGVVEGGQHRGLGIVDDDGAVADPLGQPVRGGRQGRDPLAADGHGSLRAFPGCGRVHGACADHEIGVGVRHCLSLSRCRTTVGVMFLVGERTASGFATSLRDRVGSDGAGSGRGRCEKSPAAEQGHPAGPMGPGGAARRTVAG
jgi:hypothetical protein